LPSFGAPLLSLSLLGDADRAEAGFPFILDSEEVIDPRRSLSRRSYVPTRAVGNFNFLFLGTPPVFPILFFFKPRLTCRNVVTLGNRTGPPTFCRSCFFFHSAVSSCTRGCVDSLPPTSDSARPLCQLCADCRVVGRVLFRQGLSLLLPRCR